MGRRAQPAVRSVVSAESPQDAVVEGITPRTGNEQGDEAAEVNEGHFAVPLADETSAMDDKKRHGHGDDQRDESKARGQTEDQQDGAKDLGEDHKIEAHGRTDPQRIGKGAHNGESVRVRQRAAVRGRRSVGLEGTGKGKGKRKGKRKKKKSRTRSLADSKSDGEEADEKVRDSDSDSEEKDGGSGGGDGGLTHKQRINKQRKENSVTKVLAAYDANAPAYTDTDNNIVRPIQKFNKQGGLFKKDELQFSIDRQLANASTLLHHKVTRGTITLQETGQVQVTRKGDKENRLSTMILKLIFDVHLSETDKRLAKKIGFQPQKSKDEKNAVLEHLSPNKADNSKDNVYLIVHNFANQKLPARRTTNAAKITSDFPGVSWNKVTKRWRTRIAPIPLAEAKTFLRTTSETEAARKALNTWDEALRGDVFRKHRAVIHLYDEDGIFRPRLEVYPKLSDVLRLMRPALFKRLDAASNFSSDAKEEEEDEN